MDSSRKTIGFMYLEDGTQLVCVYYHLGIAIAHMILCHTGFLDDFYAYDIILSLWVDFDGKNTGFPPSARSHFGMAIMDQKIYIWGGWSSAGST